MMLIQHAANTARSLAVIAALLFPSAAEAEAQQAQSFPQLRLVVSRGDTVFVTGTTGNVVEGRVGAVSASSLTVLTRKDLVEFSESDVSRIQALRADPLTNGTMMGLGVGVGVGLLGNIPCFGSNPPSECNPAFTTAALGLIGAVIGRAIDKSVLSKTTVYTSGSPVSRNSLRVSPIVRNSRKGIALVWTF